MWLVQHALCEDSYIAHGKLGNAVSFPLRFDFVHRWPNPTAGAGRLVPPRSVRTLRDVGAIIHALFRRGASQGTTRREAYFVKGDRETTIHDDIEKGIWKILVGLARVRPAEFVIIKIEQSAGPGHRLPGRRFRHPQVHIR